MLGLLIYCVAIAALSVGSVKRPAISLAAVLCMFGLEQWGETKIAFIASHGSFSNYVSFAIVAAGIALQFYRGRRPRLCNGLAHFCVALLYIYSAGSLIWTPVPALAVAEWRTQLPYVLMMLFVLPVLVQDAADARDGFLGTLAVGGLLTICLTFFVQWGYRSIVSDVSAAGAVKLPLALAQMGAYVFILAVIFRAKGAFGACLSIGLAAISVVLVVRTGSRGQLVAMVASAIAFLPMARGKSLSRGYISILVVVGVGALTVWAILPGLIDQISAGQNERFSAVRAVGDYEGRLSAAAALFDHYLSSGTFGMIFGLGSSASFSPDIVGFYTHIVPVEILCELGIVGAGLFALVLLLTIRSVSQYVDVIVEGQADRHASRVMAALAALFVCELLLSLKEGSLLRDTNLFLFPILIEGILNATRAKHSHRSVVEMPPVQQPAIQSR